ncbi:WD40-repeat-containing domain protein [Lentinula raphanica]|nr:WD40-repeat-containing domain protein [Lentinula raphanica]
MPDPCYKRYAAFKGLQNGVLSVSISSNGKYLVAAGLFGAAVWNLTTLERLTLPNFRSEESFNLFSTSAWLYFDTGCATTSRHVLVLGTLHGQIIALDLNEDEKELQSTRLPASRNVVQQVMSLDTQQLGSGMKTRAGVVASFADGVVKSWTLSLNGGFQMLLSINFEEAFFPKNVLFDKDSQNVLVFSREGGNRALLDRRTGKVIARIGNGCEIMAFVSIDQRGNRFVASTGFGYQLYNSNTLSYIRSFRQDPPLQDRPCQVAFGENGLKVVGGTNQGEALLFDSGSGLLEQRMKYPRDNVVQTVTTCSLEDRYYIAVAGSASGQPSEVMVWCKMRTELKKKEDPIVLALHRSTAMLLIYLLTTGVALLVLVLYLIPGLKVRTCHTSVIHVSKLL